MRPAGSIDDFLARPVGRYVVGHTYLVWCHTPELCGSAHWGRFDSRAVAELKRLYDIGRQPGMAPRFRVVLDGLRIEHLDIDAYTALSRYVASRLTEWARLIERQAVVLAPGLVGTVMAGLLPVLGRTYPFRLFRDGAEAFAWVDGGAALSEVQALVAAASGDDAQRVALRRYLDANLVAATLDGAARALGTSARSLQRHLAAAGSSFRAELTGRRVVAVLPLLSHGNDKIEALARRVGFSSASHLARVFRALHGESPDAYRKRQQRSH